MAKKRKQIFITLLFIFILIGLGTFLYIRSVISTEFNISQTTFIKIDESKNYNSILSQINDSAKVANLPNFKIVASFLDYPSFIKSGRYGIKPGMNVLEVVRMLKNGQQTPVNLKFNNIRTKNDLAKRLSDQLMFSEQEVMDALNNFAINEKYGLNNETIATMFIPNTYEVYWNIPVDKLFDRMHTEYKKFWNENRLKKAKEINLTPTEVSVLASIVEEECFFTDEYPVVAGLYLNRLKRGQLLQADPTVKFAVGDFTIRRVLNIHTQTESPYNTYKYAGLPPGPIRIPSIKGIDSVLNPSEHNYLYMCAKEDFSGRHNFAVTHVEHERNANRYRTALNQRRIYR